MSPPGTCQQATGHDRMPFEWTGYRSRGRVREPGMISCEAPPESAPNLGLFLSFKIRGFGAPDYRADRQKEGGREGGREGRLASPRALLPGSFSLMRFSCLQLSVCMEELAVAPFACRVASPVRPRMKVPEDPSSLAWRRRRECSRARMLPSSAVSVALTLTMSQLQDSPPWFSAGNKKGGRLMAVVPCAKTVPTQFQAEDWGGVVMGRVERRFRPSFLRSMVSGEEKGSRAGCESLSHGASRLKYPEGREGTGQPESASHVRRTLTVRSCGCCPRSPPRIGTRPAIDSRRRGLSPLFSDRSLSYSV